ncbi:hypothetical protein L4C34_05255 [Vibrio profundum]|uniref:hypothetical protein n=1 Tax=Vibrio profundum TaxID=2910247 RepID=UPI003D0BC456
MNISYQALANTKYARNMHSWESWKHLYKKQMVDVSGYEECLVDGVFRKLPNLSPSDVVPQYHFLDENGQSHYIDFMILDEEMGVALPIEIDGEGRDGWRDFLARQNALISQFGTVLRVSRHQMFTNPANVIGKVHRALRRQRLTRTPTEENRRQERIKLVAVYEKKLITLSQEPDYQHDIQLEIRQLSAAVTELNEQGSRFNPLDYDARSMKKTIRVMLTIGAFCLVGVFGRMAFSSHSVGVAGAPRRVVTKLVVKVIYTKNIAKATHPIS